MPFASKPHLCKFLDFFYGKVNKFFRKSFDVCHNY